MISDPRHHQLLYDHLFLRYNKSCGFRLAFPSSSGRAGWRFDRTCTLCIVHNISTV